MTSFKIAFTAFGGGAAAIPIIKQEYVDHLHWTTEDDFSDFTIITNVLPGPTIAKLVMLITKQKFGMWGAIVGVLSVLLPTPIALIAIITLLRNLVTPQEIQKITVAILPAVLFMLLFFIYQYFKISTKKCGIWAASILTLTTVIAYGAFKISAAIIFIIAILGIAAVATLKKWRHE